MDEQVLKDTIAKNLIFYRKQNQLTQLELAEKLNYSDKSISKWERAESIPDVFILHQLAELYHITLNDFLNEEPKKEVPVLKTHRLLISLLSTGLVWLVAVIAFVLLKIFLSNLQKAWLPFIYAIPISAIVLIVLSGVWHKRLICCIIISVLIWGMALSIFLSIPLPSIWLIFIVAIPLQILTILWFLFRKSKHANPKP